MRILYLLIQLSFLLLCCMFQRAGAEEADLAGRAPWTMLGHDARHTGRNPFMGLREGAASIKNRFEIGKNGIISSPSVDSAGTIYLGAAYLYAFKPNGTMKWKYADSEYDEYLSPAIGQDGTIYATSVCDYGCGFFLHAIDARGRLKWKRKANSAPTLDQDGTIYFTWPTQDGTYVNAVRPDGSRKWQRRIDTGNGGRPPAVGQDGTVYVTSGGTIYALGRVAGNIFWSHKTESSSLSIPSIGANNTIFAGGNDSYLYAVSSSGQRKWKFKLSGPLANDPPAIGIDGTIYASVDVGDLFAVNPNGNRKWKFRTGSSYLTSPVIDKDGVIYLGSIDSIYAITSNGKLRWKVNRSAAALSLANGRLYAGAHGDIGTGKGIFLAVR